MNVGKGNARKRICGRYGVGRMNKQGKDFVEWSEENELSAKDLLPQCTSIKRGYQLEC